MLIQLRPGDDVQNNAHFFVVILYFSHDSYTRIRCCCFFFFFFVSRSFSVTPFISKNKIKDITSSLWRFSVNFSFGVKNNNGVLESNVNFQGFAWICIRMIHFELKPIKNVKETASLSISNSKSKPSSLRKTLKKSFHTYLFIRIMYSFYLLLCFFIFF